MAITATGRFFIPPFSFMSSYFGVKHQSNSCSLIRLPVGLPLVVTVSVSKDHDSLLDDVTVVEACRRLEELGADVVGLNCYVGPKMMLPLLKPIREACKVCIVILRQSISLV